MTCQQTTVDRIRELAAEGHSRTSAAEAMGIPYHKLRDMLALITPAVEWGNPQKSPKGLAANAAKKGRFTDAQKVALTNAVAKVQENRMVEVQGVKGTMSQLCKHFGQVGYGTAKSRMRLGWSIEDAVTKPRVDPRTRT